ncbi:miraculin-like protein [Carex littledalei]|uniref:Miraculin-like protein n=1 Tax=Carex littledalei TaxID=544730 RepID=A0A833QGJ5_9POAL|nr:miraculin-like protein [Carex littledalei]
MQHLHILVCLPAIFLILLHSKSGKPLEPIFDTEGNELIQGEKYYIIPSNCGPEGGLIVTQKNTTWTLFVAQDISPLNNGNPITIIPVTNTHPVRLSSSVHIQFVSCASCLESVVWKIGDPQGAYGRRHVVLAGEVRGDTGHGVGQFRIEKVETGHGGHIIIFCPKVCKLCRSACQNVGAFIEGGKSWLGLEGLPLIIAFKKNNQFYDV